MEQYNPAAGMKPPGKERAPAPEYTAQAASPLVNGEVRLTVGEEALAVTAPLDAAGVPYADISALEHTDSGVTVKTDGGVFAFSRMGGWSRPFYDALCEAYNKKVLRALFVAGRPLLEASGRYRYAEDGMVADGTAILQVHESCVCILPPGLDARRLPLCFLSAFEKGGYDVSLQLQTGERYTFSKLGYDHGPFAACIENQLRAMRERALDTVREIDSSLSAAQASAIARLMPEGAAAPLGELSAIAPSFAGALGRRIGESRISESLGVFAELCDPAQICVGIKRSFARASAPGLGDIQSVLAGPAAGVAPDGTGGGEPQKAGEEMLWLMAPGQKPGTAAVEFAGGEGAAAATFLYNYSQPWEVFRRRLNLALEAIQFRREVIRLSDEELRSAEHADDRMAVRRNDALRYVRACFAKRAIHRTAGVWRREMQAHLAGGGA